MRSTSELRTHNSGPDVALVTGPRQSLDDGEQLTPLSHMHESLRRAPSQMLAIFGHLKQPANMASSRSTSRRAQSIVVATVLAGTGLRGATGS